MPNPPTPFSSEFRVPGSGNSSGLAARHSPPATRNPCELGYYMPAEWSPHEATWLAWPKNPDTFPPEILPNVENIYCQMVAALRKREKVKILVDDEEQENFVAEKLEKSGAGAKNVQFHRIKSADVWMRDYCPLFLANRKSGGRVLVKWRFNAWGGKYDDLMADDETGEAIARATGLKAFSPGMVLEGGSIDPNGKGSMLTTEQCLLNKNRNPGMSKKQIEQMLESHLGANNVIWLKQGLEGDDTDGHVDDFARFVNPNTVVCAFEENKKDANHAALKENLAILKNAKTEEGGNLTVLKLPMPNELSIPERRLPASYANFYIGNGCVLLPVFGDPKDHEAIAVLQGCFPKREIVPIHARDLVYGYGGIHCVTQQEVATIAK